MGDGAAEQSRRALVGRVVARPVQTRLLHLLRRADEGAKSGG
jgi:hypothetical protein